jgi:hypothetical protein
MKAAVEVKNELKKQRRAVELLAAQPMGLPVPRPRRPLANLTASAISTGAPRLPASKHKHGQAGNQRIAWPSDALQRVQYEAYCLNSNLDLSPDGQRPSALPSSRTGQLLHHTPY